MCLGPNMTMNEWRLSQRMSYQKLAEKVGASHAAVARRWCLPAGHKDRMVPARKFMLRIIEATLGQVKADDFYRVR